MDLQKTAYLALCFQPPVEMLGVSFLLKVTHCWTFHVSECG